MQGLPATCHTRSNTLLRLRREKSRVTWTSLIQGKRPTQNQNVRLPVHSLTMAARSFSTPANNGPMPRLVPHAVKTIAAVDRPVTAWAKRHRGVSATAGTHNGEHLPLLATIAATVSRLASTGVAARRAVSGVVREAARSVKHLLTYCEHEIRAAVAAFQGNVRKGHDYLASGAPIGGAGLYPCRQAG